MTAPLGKERLGTLSNDRRVWVVGVSSDELGGAVSVSRRPMSAARHIADVEAKHVERWQWPKRRRPPSARVRRVSHSGASTLCDRWRPCFLVGLSREYKPRRSSGDPIASAARRHPAPCRLMLT
jgi:hypothetical protein